MYDPGKYWQDRGQDYRVDDDTTEELENLAGLIQGDHCPARPVVLEVGSGYGRLFNYLVTERLVLEQKRYFMADIVQSMITRCHAETGVMPRHWNGQALPWNDNTFDLVISFSVLLHVPPADVEQHFAECVRVSRGLIFLATYAGGHPGPLSKHCFEHDHDALFASHGLTVVDHRSFRGGLRGNWLLQAVPSKETTK